MKRTVLSRCLPVEALVPKFLFDGFIQLQLGVGVIVIGPEYLMGGSTLDSRRGI